MSRKKKVLILASVASMIDQFNMPNIHLLLEMGYEVHVLCNFKKGNTCDAARIRKFRRLLQKKGIIQHQWECPRNIGNIRKCWDSYQQLSRLLYIEHFSWIHCHSPIGGVLARLAAHAQGISIIYTVHGFHFYKGAPLKNWLFYYPVERWLAYWTDVLITVNKEDYCFAKRYLKAGKVSYLPGVGIDRKAGMENRVSESKTDRAKKLHSKFDIPQEAVILLSVGELNKNKNHQIVIDALARLKRKDVYYLICGQGSRLDALWRHAVQRGVGSFVRMPGYQEHIQWIYKNTDIFVFPSKREGMPVALMEAMAAGLPCIASDIRGNRELIDDRGGKLFSLKSRRQLLESIAELLEHPQRRAECGNYNRKKIAAYELESVQKRMKKIYTQMERQQMVSILVAVYNPNLEWLERQLSSIDKQTFQNYEVILMDDASDQTQFSDIQKVAARSFGTTKKVSVYRSRRNEGSNKTFEKLLRMAKGNYTAFCDQDDIWEEEKLAELIKAMKREHAVMAYSDMSVIDQDGTMIYPSLKKMRKCLKFVSGSNLTAYYLADNCTAGCSMMAKTDVMNKAIPFYTLTYCDQWTAACISSYGKVVFVDKQLVRYRRHGKNQTKSFRQIKNKHDYYTKRVLPMYDLVREMADRGIHFKYEKEIWEFAHARKNGNIFKIWRYRKFSKKYAYLDILMICLPDEWAKNVLSILRNMRNSG